MGKFSHFDYVIFFRWVETQPPTRKTMGFPIVFLEFFQKPDFPQDPRSFWPQGLRNFSVNVEVWVGPRGWWQALPAPPWLDRSIWRLYGCFSENSGLFPPKSSILLIGVSIIFIHPFWGTTIFKETPICPSKTKEIPDYAKDQHMLINIKRHFNIQISLGFHRFFFHMLSLFQTKKRPCVFLRRLSLRSGRRYHSHPSCLCWSRDSTWMFRRRDQKSAGKTGPPLEWWVPCPLAVCLTPYLLESFLTYGDDIPKDIPILNTHVMQAVIWGWFF